MADVNWNLALFDPFKAQKEGSDYATQTFDQGALLKAGNQYAGGDYAGAANTVASRGDFATAGKLQDYATNREAGNLYAGGDYSGAGKALARGGNLTGAETLADKQIKTVEAQQNALGKVGGFLEASGGAPDAWDWAARSLQAVGVQPDTITKLQQQYATNPKQTVAQMKALANHKYTYEKTDDGVLRQFDESGNLTHTFGSDAAFSGKGDLIAQAWNIVLDPKADRNSPKYRAAITELQRTENRFDAATGIASSTTPRDISWLTGQRGQQQGTAPPSGTPTPVVPGSDALGGPRASNVADTPSGVTPHDYTGTDADTYSGKAALADGTAAAPNVAGATVPPSAPAPTPTSRGTIYQSPNMTVRQVTPGNSGTLDREAIKNDARIWIASKGTISPQYGGGPLAQAQRNAFASEKNSIMKELRVSPEDVASGRALRVADTASLRQLTVMKGAISAYEATARNSAQLALGLLQKGGAQGQSPVLNRWIQAGRRSVLGDPDVAVFNNHLDTLADEYGKIMGGGTGSGAATEGARNEAHERINKADNAETIMRVIDGLFQEMAGRTRSTDDEIATVKARLSGYGQGAASPAATPPPQSQRGPYAPGSGPQYTPANKKLRFQDLP